MDRRVGIAVGAAALVGALALPVWRVGIGWLLAALAVAGAALAARRWSTQDGGGSPAGGRSERVVRGAAGGAALLLAAVPAIRAAGWLATLCLAAAVLLGSYALAGGRSWGGVLAGAVAVIPAAVRGPTRQPEAAQPPVRWLGRPAASLLAGTALVVIFGLLFRAADPAFRNLIDGWLSAVEPVDVVRAALGAVLVALGALSATRLAMAPPHTAGTALGSRDRGRLGSAEAPGRLRPLEWAVPLTMLNILFTIFVGVQLPILFGGQAYVLGPGGPDYAVHARAGFTLLIVVTALTLVVVAALVLVAGRTTRLERGLIRLLGGLLCALTLVIVASASHRLAVYAGAYGLTVPRLLGFAVAAWLGLVIVLLAAGVRLRASWMPRATMAAGVVVVFALVAINPDALMARTLMAHLDGPYPVDYQYLSRLSPDAAFELAALVERGRCGRAARPSDGEPWYAFNLSRYRARLAVGTDQILCPLPASSRHPAG